MTRPMPRRAFVKGTVAAAMAGALRVRAEDAAAAPKLPLGTIGKLKVSRVLLGGNLLTHFTHGRDLNYTYRLAAHYNTPAKIIQTLEVAEANGVNTLSVHTANNYSAWQPGGVIHTLLQHRKNGGKMQWIICPTAPLSDDLAAYKQMVKRLADTGCDALYLWGVYADSMVGRGKVDQMAAAVQIGKDAGMPSGVGGHDLRVVQACEEKKIEADFYIKTFHHHKYATGPKPEQIKGPTAEIPGYWCSDPQAVIETMKGVTKPWISFKIMAAGAIPPKDAIPYVFNNGADHTLLGMFDFEIAEDAAIARDALAAVKRERPWRS
jgi:hypothetical protein